MEVNVGMTIRGRDEGAVSYIIGGHWIVLADSGFNAPCQSQRRITVGSVKRNINL